MAFTTVGMVLQRVKTTLQERGTGVRWTDQELLGWLNEAYSAVILIQPAANALNVEMDCAAGSKQRIPVDGERLLSVVRNTAAASGGMAVTPTTRASLDLARRGWHGEAPALAIEQFVFEASDPQHFYVYPPATAGARLEIIYAAVPEPHDADQASSDASGKIRLGDEYAPALVDYVLFRAYSKDAEGQANLARAQMHYTAFATGLGGAGSGEAPQ
ncbi:phage adaptor protein [Stutzerimonas stutzeri]